MRKRKLSDSQIVCLTILWGTLCYLLIAYSENIDIRTIFTIIVSGVIVFAPIYKSRKKSNE